MPVHRLRILRRGMPLHKGPQHSAVPYAARFESADDGFVTMRLMSCARVFWSRLGIQLITPLMGGILRVGKNPTQDGANQLSTFVNKNCVTFTWSE
jgi:hypothetical protein